MATESFKGGSLEWNDSQFMLLATGEMVKAVTKASIFTQGVAKQLIGRAGKGRLYRRGNIKHRASKPGDPPARDTGILANSVSHKVSIKRLFVRGQVGSDIDSIRSRTDKTTDPEYGLFLELGTSRIAPRPWLRPALIKAKPRINRILQGAASKL